ncbi:hypothetical protein N8878_07065 [Psychromonas sp.]|nr:hypothetical protein [Psychromonas sp.]
MNMTKNKTLLMLTLAATLGLAACSDNNAEEAGEKIDEMVTDTQNAVEDAGDSISEAATDAGNAVEDTCEDVKENMGAQDKDC